MTTLLLIFGTSLVICLILTPFVRRLAIRHDLIDRPDGHRKTHSKPTPVAGGLAVFVAAGIAAASLFLVANPLSDEVAQQGKQMLGLLLAAGVICGTGVADDFGLLRGRHKL